MLTFPLTLPKGKNPGLTKSVGGGREHKVSIPQIDARSGTGPSKTENSFSESLLSKIVRSQIVGGRTGDGSR